MDETFQDNTMRLPRMTMRRTMLAVAALAVLMGVVLSPRWRLRFKQAADYASEEKPLVHCSEPRMLEPRSRWRLCPVHYQLTAGWPQPPPARAPCPPSRPGLRRHARGHQPVPAPGTASISPGLPDRPCAASPTLLRSGQGARARLISCRNA